ncbi:DUF397 domain-containing protein [Luedemannella helvata]|uniref:DUF397 domain-containing protein n=1 Tax=Luedemannella helvata TaxID=349315 RepID=A0ABP4VZT9_9ACTN
MVSFDQTEFAWRKSSYSAGDGNCVEVASAGDRIAIRDSKNTDIPPLVFSRESWATFITAVHEGAFDRK